MNDIAVIGGSGLADLRDMQELSLHEVTTEYGQPSAPIVYGRWHEHELFFLPRHGHPKSLPPHLINYRANIRALWQLGVRRVIALNIVGGITRQCSVGRLVVPHQLIDYTHGRAHSFYSSANPEFAYIDFTEPFTPQLRGALLAAATEQQAPCTDHAVYACTQGPRLETCAEVDKLERDGCDIIGMTLMPEAALAREQGLGYAALCLVVNAAAGRGTGTISMAEIERAVAIGIPQMLAVTAAALPLTGEI